MAQVEQFAAPCSVAPCGSGARCEFWRQRRFKLPRKDFLLTSWPAYGIRPEDFRVLGCADFRTNRLTQLWVIAQIRSVRALFTLITGI